MAQIDRYKESKERFKRLEDTKGFVLWEQEHENFRLESWRMYNPQGKLTTMIVQFFPDGTGYALYQLI